MDNLDDRREPYGAIAFVAEKLGGEKQQRWAYALTSTRPQVFANFGDGRDVRDCIASKLLFDRDNVIAQKIKDLFPVDGRRGSQFPGGSGDFCAGN